eukprot:NODE_96_length_20709_cov_1.429161.p16 type:complete len:130 gc:universal NODE_96_length_20709_cov_1.429161:16079-16468(+)
MQKEIDYAINFISTIIQKHGISQEQLSVFRSELSQLLKEKIGTVGWYVNSPEQGSARRAITNLQSTSHVDVCLQKAAIQANILDIRSLLPADFILWIDPMSVSYRCGDHGNVFTIYDGTKQVVFSDNKF